MIFGILSWFKSRFSSRGPLALLSINILGPATPRARPAAAGRFMYPGPRVRMPGAHFQLTGSDFPPPRSHFQLPGSNFVFQAPNSRILGYLEGWILTAPRPDTHFWSPLPRKSSFQYPTRPDIACFWDHFSNRFYVDSLTKRSLYGA